MTEDIRAVLREFISRDSALASAGSLPDSTPLAAYGILDSVAVLELVLFLETRFGIEFSSKDLDRRRLETIDRIASLVQDKLAKRNT